MLLEPYFNKLREELQGGRVCAAYKNLVDFIAFCMMSQNKCWNFDSPHYKIVIMEVNKWGGNIPLLPKPISEVFKLSFSFMHSIIRVLCRNIAAPM